MGLAIIIGVICAGVIGLILWARGAIAAAERRHAAQVRANELIVASRARRQRDDAPTHRPAVSGASARSSYSATTPRATSTYDASPTWADYGSSSDSYSSGGSCSSGGGDSGGGCD